MRGTKTHKHTHTTQQVYLKSERHGHGVFRVCLVVYFILKCVRDDDDDDPT